MKYYTSIMALLVVISSSHSQSVGETFEFMTFPQDIRNFESKKNSDDTFLIIWQFEYKGPRYFQLFNSKLEKLGSEQEIPGDAEDYRFHPLRDGRFVLSWAEERIENKGYYHIQFYSKSGEPTRDEYILNLNKPSRWTRPMSLREFSNNDIFCTWEDLYGRYFQLLSTTGMKLGKEVRLGGSSWPSSFSHANYFHRTPNNELVVARNDTVYYFSFTDGKIPDKKRVIEQYSEIKFRHLESGNTLLVWQQYETDGLTKGCVVDENFEPVGKVHEYGYSYHFDVLKMEDDNTTVILMPEKWDLSPIQVLTISASGKPVGDPITRTIAREYLGRDDLTKYPYGYPYGYTCEKLSSSTIMQTWTANFLPYAVPMYRIKCNLNTRTIEKIVKIRNRPLGILVFEEKDEDFLGFWINGKTLFAKWFPSNLLHHDLRSFSLRAPELDKTINTTDPSLIWQSATTKELAYLSEVVYTILLDTYPDFSSSVTMQVEGDTTFKCKNLERGQTYFWKVQAENITGDTVWSDTKAFYVSPIAAAKNEQNETLPNQFELLRNYPNPFNASTTIPFILPQSAAIQFDVYDMNGRLIFSDDQFFSSGEHSKRIDLSNLSSGLYFLTVSDGQVVEHQKLMMIK